MKGKIMAIALVAVMALSAVGMMPTTVKGDAEYIQGYWWDSNDGKATYWDGNTGTYYGVVYAHTSEDPTDVSTAQDNGGDSDKGSYGIYKWSTNSGYDPFASQPVAGDHLWVYAEFLKDGMGTADGSQPYDHKGNGVANYTFCSNWTIDPSSEGTSPANALDNMAKIEMIPQPNVTSGTTTSGVAWMNITVQAFRYDEYRYQSPNFNKATFTNSIGFRAYVTDLSSGNTTTYDITNFTASGVAPATPNQADPGSTGIWWINLTAPEVSSKPGGISTNLQNNYRIQVSALFTDGAGGVYETTGRSNPPVYEPEFTTVLVPVLATIGLFVAVSYIYRKKD